MTCDVRIAVHVVGILKLSNIFVLRSRLQEALAKTVLSYNRPDFRSSNSLIFLDELQIKLCKTMLEFLNSKTHILDITRS